LILGIIWSVLLVNINSVTYLNIYLRYRLLLLIYKFSLTVSRTEIYV